MWIRTQDKNQLLNVNAIEIYKDTIKGFTPGYDVVLGAYSTEEKALKVMDMIERCINKVEEFKAQGENIQENYLGYGNSKARLRNFIFKMPEDNEV